MQFNLNLEDIKYVKILGENPDGKPCTIKAALKKMDEKELIACSDIIEETKLQENQEITLSIVCQDGLYRTKTILKEVSEDEPYRFFYLDTPKGLEYQQNREYFRISANYGCAYYVHSDGEVQSYTTETCDISANGVSIMLPELVISEEDSEIEMMLEERYIRANIQYVRSEKQSSGYKLSFMFTNISDKDRDYISQICIKKQLELKRNKTL